MITIGLTGGIACGKTTIASELYKLGARIIDADKLARDVVEPGKPAYDDIVREFGTDILNEDSSIDRKALGARVFGDDALRERLAKITHPRIFEAQALQLQQYHKEDPNGFVILEVALLVETGSYRKMDYNIIAFCNPEQQLARIMDRDGLDATQAHARLRAQWPVVAKMPMADFFIDTSGDVDWTILQVDRLYPHLVALAEDHAAEE